MYKCFWSVFIGWWYDLHDCIHPFCFHLMLMVPDKAAKQVFHKNYGEKNNCWSRAKLSHHEIPLLRAKIVRHLAIK